MTENNCEVCKYKDEQTGEHCYACVKGYENNFEEEMLTRETACDKVKGEWIETLELFDDEEYPRKVWSCSRCGFSYKFIHDRESYCTRCGSYNGYAPSRGYAPPRISEEEMIIKGEWIQGEYWSEGCGMGEQYGYYYKCSNCGKIVKGGYYKCDDNYCRKCGSRNVNKKGK